MLADIHANRQAFDAVLEHARRMGAQRFALLGDLVGYGGDPGYIIDQTMRLMQAGAAIVRGNHDEMQDRPGADMTKMAAGAAAWTRSSLSATQRAFLNALPLTLKEDDRLYVHGDATAPERWRYVTDADAAAKSLAATSARIVFCGHVHKAAIYGLAPGGRVNPFLPTRGQAAPLLKQRRWHVVLGSVGQPRDGDPTASYALYDTTTSEIAFHRVAYDVEAAATAIRAAGLPDGLAERLYRGR